MAMTLVSTVTVGSGGASSIEFTNIPQTGKDLLLVLSLRSNKTVTVAADPIISFNGSTTGYSQRQLWGNGADSFSGSFARFTGVANATGSTANTFSNFSVYVSNYTTSSNKSFSTDAVNENNAAEAYQIIQAGLWSNSAAITSVAFTENSSASWVQHSTASLYIIE